MKVNAVILLAIVLPIATTGCAADMFRTAAVSSVRSEAVSPQSNSLTSTLAVDLFSRVASQLGFIVKGPIKLGQFTNSPVEYTADAPNSAPGSKTSLAMLIDDKKISFAGNVYGNEVDFVTAQKAAALFEQELDKRGIQYKTSTGKSMYQGSPF